MSQINTPVEYRLGMWVKAAKAGDVGAVDMLRTEIDRLNAEVVAGGATISRLINDNLHLNQLLNKGGSHNPASGTPDADVRARITALLDTCYQAGRTWLPAADIRKALDTVPDGS
jgi:hypothetical protein